MTREELNESKQKEIFKEENREKRKKIVFLTLKIIVLTIIIFSSFYFYVTYVSMSSIIVKEKRIVDKKLPQNFNGLKIIQFSDLKYGSNITLAKFQEIVNIINERKPDIVIFNGDLIDENYEINSKEQENIIKYLKNIQANLGKYAVIGDKDGENYVTIMNQSDFNILNNDYDLIYDNKNEPILITGFSSLLKEEIDVDKSLAYYTNESANSNIYSIAIFHEPDSAKEILNKHSIDLLLAGHSLNGTIKIPFVGPLKKIDGASSYTDEFYNISNSKLFITSGIGTHDKDIRLFCRPSINFFRIANS